MIKAILSLLLINSINLMNEDEKYNDTHNVRYRTRCTFWEFTDKEKNSLDVLINEARKLMLNL